MSIKKLKLFGIRAFTQEQPAALEMHAPLTLIVGHNGTGKTTIVEALKYATTGGLPPNARNGAFVHDPRISQERETKAQIMMKFTSCAGDEYIVVRGLSQTLGKIKRETKTTESVLWKVERTGKRMICNKLSEVDLEVPILMGTTGPVLENVIFVHQEESAWPFSDPSAVKKKIDGIFSSSRFVKAIDALVSLKKEKSGDLKILECKYEGLQQKTQHKHVIQQRIERIVDRLKLVRNMSLLGSERMKQAQNSLKEAQVKYDQALLWVRQKEKAESELAGLSTKELLPGSVNDLEAQLKRTECTWDADELAHEESVLRVDEDRVLLSIRKFEELKVVVSQSKMEVDGLLQEKIKNTQNILEKVNASRAHLHRVCSVLAEVIDEIGKLQDRACDGVLDAIMRQVDGVLQRDRNITETCALVGTPLEVEALVDDEMGCLEGVKGWICQIDKILDQRLQRKESSVRLITEEIGVHKEKYRNIQNRVSEIRNIMDVDLADADTSFIMEIQENEDILNRVYTKKEYNKDVIFMEIEEIQRKLDASLKETEKRKEKEFLQEEIARKEKELEYIAFPSDIKRGMSLQDIMQQEDALHERICTLDGKIKEMQQSHQKNMQKKILEDAKEIAYKMIDQKRIQKVQDILENISGELVVDQVPLTKLELLQRIKEGFKVNLQAEMEDGLSDVIEAWGSISASEKIYEEFLSRANEGCPFCKSFISTGVSKGHIQKIKNILECIKAKKAEIQEEMKIKRERRNTSQKEVVLKSLINELSALLVHQVDRSGQSEVDEARRVEESLALLDTFNKNMSAIKNIRGKYQEIESLKERAAGICLVNECYNAISQMHKQKMDDLQEVEKLEQKEQEYYNDLEERKKASRDRIKNIEKTLEQRNKYRKEAVSLEKESASLEEERKKTEAILQEKTEMLAEITRHERIYYKAKDTLQAIKITSNNLVEMTSLKERLCEIFARIDVLSRKVYTEEHCAAEDALREKLHEIEQKKALVNNKLAAVLEMQAHKQLIKDSIRAAILMEKIKECTATQGTLDCLQEEIQRIECSLMKEQKTISECAGEVYNLEKQKEEDEADIKVHESAESDELSAFIMIKVLKESISDLEKYIQSVQAAIVRYHAEKLAEVNAIIKEIWCIAYKGTDIDEIKIISHMDKTYSLVMVKNGSEIDMRGRVSAGQKVIASIVIRLALAEAFSVNCGFLTLDEPTTNLDKENIAGLAKALSSIIQARKAEGNFQLLVITHDEDFVRELLSTECTEYFYRLERDTIGTPRIVQLSIYDL
ncbi:hypothetical protein NERG_01305 [Nematocida ausubeli]|uniref:Rad50/SbcC-type AAA domain-containing protein n=1 Tax=Nematocida ausubeli (strain ATCC PRA-371 / ERTm2) TaxID=1913371 RepID=H8ZC62_NEMA1|nr:hypothetical protein NERG_01305 [Nematocida ausubeli]